MENRKIKILHFPIKNSNGGVTRSAIKFWKYIDHSRFQIDFATCSKKLDFEQDLVDQGCKVHYISCYAEQNQEQFCKELKEILLQGYDAVHLNTSWWRSFLAEKVACEVGIRIIVVHARSIFIDVSDDKQREKELLVHEKCKEAFSPELATHFLTCSTEAADFLFGPQISRDRIKMFHNALDIGRYNYDDKKRAEMRTTLEVEDKFVIGNVGRMSYAKNQLFLVDCFYEIKKKTDNAVLLFIGKGELEEDVRKRVDSYHINDSVIFAGTVDNTEDYLQAMDVFALPSRFEGMPNVLIEAQTAGLQCVTSNHVTKDAKITDNVIFVELDRDKWVSAILQYAGGYARQKVDKQIRNAGYDICQEIKILEQIYAGEI